jgi:dTMP kinase
MSGAHGPGLFLTFEGVEGSGKSTQLARLAARLREGGLRVLATREPGGTDLGRSLRAVLLRPAEAPMHRLTELLLYVADRAEHLATVVRPALERGDVVLCDRYLDATLAYQGHGRGLDLAEIRALHDRAPLDLRPQRTVLLDLDPESGLERARRRDRGAAARGAGRFEAEEHAFHRRVREGYLELAREAPERFRVVSAAASAAEVEREVWHAIADLFPATARPGSSA